MQVGVSKMTHADSIKKDFLSTSRNPSPHSQILYREHSKLSPLFLTSVDLLTSWFVKKRVGNSQSFYPQVREATGHSQLVPLPLPSIGGKGGLPLLALVPSLLHFLRDIGSWVVSPHPQPSSLHIASSPLPPPLHFRSTQC